MDVTESEAASSPRIKGKSLKKGRLTEEEDIHIPKLEVHTPKDYDDSAWCTLQKNQYNFENRLKSWQKKQKLINEEHINFLEMRSVLVH